MPGAGTARSSRCSAHRTGAASHMLRAGCLLLPPLEMGFGVMGTAAFCLPLLKPNFAGGWPRLSNQIQGLDRSSIESD